jgi:hypothetical protein
MGSCLFIICQLDLQFIKNIYGYAPKKNGIITRTRIADLSPGPCPGTLMNSPDNDAPGITCLHFAFDPGEIEGNFPGQARCVQCKH